MKHKIKSEIYKKIYILSYWQNEKSIISDTNTNINSILDIIMCAKQCIETTLHFLHKVNVIEIMTRLDILGTSKYAIQWLLCTPFMDQLFDWEFLWRIPRNVFSS